MGVSNTQKYLDRIEEETWGSFFSRFTLPHTLNPFYINLNGFNIHNIQHGSGNQPLKGPALGSTDKCTTFLPLAWSIKPDFPLTNFSYEVTFC